ncbi:transposase family protein [Streptomyces chattanoogensis]|uniref:transposase family protein n=1 Tax=Streptomyces chattanoogensis TaxID=66876 RepID=UPI00368E4B99
MVFTDRLLMTLVHRRTGLTHAALGVLYAVGSSMIGRAISEIRPLLAACGFVVPDRPGVSVGVHAIPRTVSGCRAKSHREMVLQASSRSSWLRSARML